MKLTREQALSVKRLWFRMSADHRGTWGAYTDPRGAYRAFRKSVPAFHGVAMIGWCGMVIGIEPDGHTHS
jgi:hypothetical protein